GGRRGSGRDDVFVRLRHGGRRGGRRPLMAGRPISDRTPIIGRVDERGASICVKGLRHAYPAPEGTLPVLDGVDLAVPASGYCTLGGPSGSGKSTLLSLIGGLEPPQAGTLEVGGLDLAGLSGDRLAAYRRDTVGFVFQDFGLLDTLSARENVELAAALDRSPPAARRRRADDLLEAVGLSERARHRPAQLSGGERQRVAMARALVNRPRLLL